MVKVHKMVKTRLKRHGQYIPASKMFFENEKPFEF
jgi:hypothetical protein